MLVVYATKLSVNVIILLSLLTSNSNLIIYARSPRSNSNCQNNTCHITFTLRASNIKMPHFRLETNIPQDKIPADLPQKLSQLISKLLPGKPLNYCVGTVIGGVNMSWGGTNEPAAQASLMSIGAMGVEENKKYSKAFSELITKELGLPADRMYIHFHNVQAADVGYTGTTFHDIWGQ